jgi:large subunit ribosomal protein L30
MAQETWKKVRITLVKSPIGYQKNQKEIVKSLGLRRLNASRIVDVTPQMQGMIEKVSHMLAVEEVTDAE